MKIFCIGKVTVAAVTGGGVVTRGKIFGVKIFCTGKVTVAAVTGGGVVTRATKISA